MAAGTLQRAGLIQNGRGKMTIFDPEGLEEVACEGLRAHQEQEEQLAG